MKCLVRMRGYGEEPEDGSSKLDYMCEENTQAEAEEEMRRREGGIMRLKLSKQGDMPDVKPGKAGTKLRCRGNWQMCLFQRRQLFRTSVCLSLCRNQLRYQKLHYTVFL